MQEVRGEQLVDRGHVDAVKAGGHNRRASHADMNLAGPALFANAADQHFHGRRADDRVLDQQHAFALQHFAQRRVLGFDLALAVGAPFDEGAARVAIADQSFQRGNLELESHRVGRRLAGVGHGHHDRVFVDRHRFQPGQFFAQALCGTGRRCGRPSCWPRWRNRSTRRNNGPAAGWRRSDGSRTCRR